MRRLLIFLALAACARAAAPPAEVAQVIAFRDTVNVVMSDGALCVSPRPGGAQSWSGTLQGCPHALPVRVTLPPQAPVRRALVKGAGPTVVIGDTPWG